MCSVLSGIVPVVIINTLYPSFGFRKGIRQPSGQLAGFLFDEPFNSISSSLTKKQLSFYRFVGKDICSVAIINLVFKIFIIAFYGQLISIPLQVFIIP